MLAVQLLAYVSFYILGAKVRSRALLFLYKLFFQLVYHVFYRNLVRPALPSAKMRTTAKLKYTVRTAPLSQPIRHRPTAIHYLGHHHLSPPDVENVVSPTTALHRLSIAL